jgi:FkbM family methyltransferase
MTFDIASACADPAHGFEQLADEIGLGAVRRFYAWGAGDVGAKVAHGLKAKGYEFLGFIDSAPEKWGRRYAEGEIFAPAAGLDTGEDVACIVTIWHYRHDFPETERRARALGFGTVAHFSLAAVALGLDGVLPNYCVDHPRTTFNSRAAPLFPLIAGRLADARSRQVFEQILQFRFAPKPEHAPAQDLEWPFDPALITGLIDIGACIGEFCDTALATFANLRRIRAYEPDPQNFRRLMDSAVTRRADIAFTARNTAVSDRHGVTRFSATGNWGSHITPDGEIEVETVKLDDDGLAFAEPGFTLLKMDVEGNEIPALEGMAALMRDRSLIVMVTIEHLVEDLFELPQRLMARDNCRLFMRAFDTEVCMDTCYVSVPEEAFGG